MKRKKPEMKIMYEYMKPKTQEEAEKAEQRFFASYDILFDATLKSMEKEGYQPEFLDKFR